MTNKLEGEKSEISKQLEQLRSEVNAQQAEFGAQIERVNKEI